LGGLVVHPGDRRLDVAGAAHAPGRRLDQHGQRPGDRGARNFGRDLGLFRMSMETKKERSRTVSWEDPFIAMQAAPGRTGLELLSEIFAGKLPPPPITQTMGF